MKLKSLPELQAFLSTGFPDTDMDTDDQTARAFAERAGADKKAQVISQAKRMIEADEFPLEEIGTEANRWFGDADEGREWLRKLIGILDADSGSDSTVVKDSNGAVLAEGDSVTVIKDLKVKGGSSDLKRGTMIKKIHLIGDPDNIECRVDGSTLVLKTCFLKKA